MGKNCAQAVNNPWDSFVDSYTHLPHPDTSNWSSTIISSGKTLLIPFLTHPQPPLLSTDTYRLFNLLFSNYSPLSPPPITTTTIYN